MSRDGRTEHYQYDYPSLEPIFGLESALGEFDAPTAALSPAGTQVAHSVEFDAIEGTWNVRVLETATDQVVWTLTPELRFPDYQTIFRRTPLAFSTDGSLLVVIGQGRDVVYRLTDESTVLEGSDVATFDQSWSADGSLLLTVHSSELRLWAIFDASKPVSSRALLTDDLPGLALSVLTRGLTDGECRAYVERCPSRDDMTSR